MKLNVPILSQRDPQWASQRLGTVDGTTIGGYGCIITCMTMLAQYYGHNLTPADMDNWLTDNSGYVQGNLYRNDAFGREFSDCRFDSVTFCTDVPAPLGQIDNYLAQGKPVVIMVDFDHDPNDGVQTHFVLIVGKDQSGNYFINDPWYGDQVYLIARYGENQAQAINQLNFFSGPVPTVAAPTPLPQPNPGYAATFAGATVQQGDKTYRSYESNGKFLWTVQQSAPVEQPAPEVVVTPPIEIPITVTTDNKPSTQAQAQVPSLPDTKEIPPVEAKPLPMPSPKKPRMSLYNTIVFALLSIFNTLKKRG